MRNPCPIAISLLLSVLVFTGCGGSPSTPPQTQPPPTQPPPNNVPGLPLWTGLSHGASFTMVGTDPNQSGAGSTNVPVVIIPISFSFAGGATLSPRSVPCGDIASASALSRTVNSPMFVNMPWTDGATLIGNTQFPDFYQRTNFWQVINSRSPNYHLLLQPVKVLPEMVINVPANVGASSASTNPNCPGNFSGSVPIGFMTNVAQNIIANQPITPDTLPIFLTFNTDFALPSGGSYIGFHRGVRGGNTYIAVSYTDPGFNARPGVLTADTAILSHELAEWMDDPYLDNLVSPWNEPNTGQPCQNQLEVGDPIEFSLYTVNASGFDYHIQELAYFSWFTRDVPSLAINSRYSTLGTFVAPAAPCP